MVIKNRSCLLISFCKKLSIHFGAVYRSADTWGQLFDEYAEGRRSSFWCTYFSIVAIYPGTTPKDMEQLIVDPIEEELYQLSDIKKSTLLFQMD